ncbi:MAG: DUF4278 domain-containing protein [Microcystaceae cyanobacterium]
MKLSYRGISYEREHTPLDTQEGDIAGKYRGQEWRYHYPRHIPQSPPKLYRQYRGVAYSCRPLGETETKTYQKAYTKTTCSIPCHQPIIENEISQVHLDNMRRNLERRLKVAEANGDEALVKLLQKESQQLTMR